MSSAKSGMIDVNEFIEIVEVKAYVVKYKGGITSGLRESREDAEALVARRVERYGNAMAFDTMFAPMADVGSAKTKRGGPYRFTLPEGHLHKGNKSGTIPADSEKEARSILATWLERKRLPKGTVVERAND